MRRRVAIFLFGGIVMLTQAGWAFQTGGGTDTSPPVIEYDPIPINIMDRVFTNRAISVRATDDKGVASLTMKHRKVTEAIFTSLNAMSLSPIVLNPNMLDDMGMEYFFEAIDLAGNKTRHPAAENTYHKTTVRFNAASTPTLAIPGGGTAQSWRMISIPYDVGPTQLTDIFKAFGPAGRNSWMLITYSSCIGGQHWNEHEDASGIERGKGYFINMIVDATISLNDVTAPNYGRGNLFKMDLVKGWNQIGNPYSVSINWNDVRTFSGATPTVKELYQFGPGGYVKDTDLKAGTGGFVFAAEAVNDLPICFPGQVPSRMKGFDFGPIDSESWRIDMKLRNGSVESATGGVGMSPESDNSFDQWDDINPPGFKHYLEMNFHHPEFFYKQFGRDVVKTTDEHVWEFDVETNLEGPTTLSWDNSVIGNGLRGLYLYDVDTQTPTDMKANNAYSFEPKTGRRFRVYYGENVLLMIKPTKPLLGVAFPNPAESFVTIPFSIPETNCAARVMLEVFDMIGRRVSTVIDDQLGSGFYKANWVSDEEEDANGFYIYRLTVDDTVLSGRVLLKR